ncbi:hypothetical protein SAMN06272722_110126 [Paenibacillus sp. RU5A]|nr:hypothetical protein SAMN03159332_6267 [Paenibacillus sp. 276b]SLK16301.1 hypothetical protein SAMN06272722_110126 [Paenibacillus sp. RU5A]SOC74308.1 hypothetical protein SAMN05880581_110126 [Paenibacillus sp. RU26A]SOC76449.1 hypothetical protein SAMN05880586_110126 [Paenibacillus sp. RU5M]
MKFKNYRICCNEACGVEFHSLNKEAQYCFKCKNYLLNLMPLFHVPYKTMPYKTMDELRKYDYSVCHMKRCRKKVFLKQKCKRCYILTQTNNT